MGLRRPRAVEIELSEGEREQLVRWARRRRTAAGLATRSRIVLACAQGKSNRLVRHLQTFDRKRGFAAGGGSGSASRFVLGAASGEFQVERYEMPH